MASAYPGTLDSFATNKTDSTTTPTDHAGHHNDLADAVNKIEAELGTDPAGAESTVSARLDALGTPLWWQAATVGDYDDYFTADNSADWTAVAVTGTATWSYGFRAGLGPNRGPHAIFEDQTSGDFPAYLKSLSGIAVGDYIQAAVNVIKAADSAEGLFGIALTDGTATSSNMVGAYLNLDNNEEAKIIGAHGTLTATSTFPLNSFLGKSMSLTPIHLRLVYSATNTFQVHVSLNGDDFTQVGANISKTMTPTHGGFSLSTLGAGEIHLGHGRYFHSDVTAP